MNLWLRVLGVILGTLFAPRRHFTDDFELWFRVWPTDLDTNLHMNNGRYLSVMDLGRLDMILRMRLVPVIWRERWMPVIASAQVRWRRSLAPFERYRLTTRLIAWEDRWFFIEQRFLDRRGRLCAVALVKGAFRGRHGAVPVREVMGAAGECMDSPELPADIRRWNEAEQALRRRTNAEAGEPVAAAEPEL